ncbi:unnamed protein product [Hermetia illucens]|uniref:Hyaluronan/mRNA-binding protein domain-containing protein n=1 Tax=Hermetia illucens TaxID=343691 RepID=A0A7R8V6T5_HERIL|nr:plasminogen activator inhibitor 1 RNA-binding protein-like [Hermetia illucens]CAD7093941.1 unnamed protein product [Hermetia illucens]
MDVSSANRYGLLCMDDDASDPLEKLVRKKNKQQKQQQKTPGAVPPGGGMAEKENKSAAMNKNVDKKPAGSGIGGLPTVGQKAMANHTGSAGAPGGGAINVKDQYRNNQDQQRPPREGKNPDRNVNFKSETREQRNNRRNRNEDRQYQQIQHNGNISGEYQNTTERPQRQRGSGGGSAGGPPRRNFGGKREFDRQSGSDKTGVKAVDKRDGAGAHNWGSHKQDLEDLNKTSEDVATDKDDSAGEQPTEQAAVIEEETKELTLDEWKAQRAVRAKPQFNIRKAGEGEDLSQWKKMIALNNKKKDDESEEELEYDPSMYPQRVGRLQRVLDIEFHFNDGRRVGGLGGRGRGRPRGNPGAAGGGAGGGRREGRPRNTDQTKIQEDRHRGSQNAPKVDDEHDFPSLG